MLAKLVMRDTHGKTCRCNMSLEHALDPCIFFCLSEVHVFRFTSLLFVPYCVQHAISGAATCRCEMSLQHAPLCTGTLTALCQRSFDENWINLLEEINSKGSSYYCPSVVLLQ